MDRREFLAKAGLTATWAGVIITLGACSDDDDDNPTGPKPPEGDVEGVVVRLDLVGDQGIEACQLPLA